MKRMITTLALAATMVLGTASVALAGGGATCSDFLGVKNHGEHVRTAYVKGEKVPGGPGAGGHLPAGVAPGASFCISQSNSPGLHF